MKGPHIFSEQDPDESKSGPGVMAVSLYCAIFLLNSVVLGGGNYI